MDFLEDNSYFESDFEMEVDSDDWCTKDGAIQNKNYEENNIVEIENVEVSNKLQKCFLCSKSLYYDSFSLLQHNLTHLRVNIERLPDEIFQFYELVRNEFSPDVFSAINQYSNKENSDIKPEIDNILLQSDSAPVFDEETLNKNIEGINNTELVLKRNMTKVDTPVNKFEIEEINTENTNAVLGDKLLNKIQGHNDSKNISAKRKLQNFFSNIIRFEIVENSADEFDAENLVNDIERHNNNIEYTSKEQQQNHDNSIIKSEVIEINSDDSSDQSVGGETIEYACKEQQQKHNSVIKNEVVEINSDNSSDQSVVEENFIANREHNIIESETVKQLQRLDSSIIKCEIEELHSDYSIDLLVETTKTCVKETDDEDRANKNSNCDNPIVKCEIEELHSDNSINLLVETTKTCVEETDDEDRANKNSNCDSPIVKCEIDEMFSDMDLFELGNTEEKIEDSCEIDNVKKDHQEFSNPTVKTEIEEENSNNTDLSGTKKKNKAKKIKEGKAETNKKPRQCKICEKFISHKYFGQHIKEVHTQNEINCTLCGKVFKCRKTMRTHVKNVHFYTNKKNSTFRCDNCQSTFTNKDCLQKHMKNVHGKAVKCEICGSRLASEIYLGAHMRRVHYDDGNVHSCEICGKIFKSPRYVRVHMKNSHYVSSKSWFYS